MATKKRVTAGIYSMGDDIYSWAVFLDGYPVITGISKSQTAYYKRMVRERNGLAEKDERWPR